MRRKPRTYHIGDADGSITASQLRRASAETQREVMEGWFRENFEDPAESCPHDSGEGGYQYIYGGPYEAHEVLQEEFEGVVRESVLSELAEELSNESWEWSGKDRGTDTDFDPTLSNYIFQSLTASAGPLLEFQRSINEIQTLLKDPIADGAAGQCLLRLLYVNVITALEAYLADLFSTAITEHKELFRKFVETNPEFEKEKLPFSDVFKAWEGLDAKVKAYLVEIVWHHLARIKPMFRDTLGIEFPNADELFKAVLVRHDIVHRNGKKKGGGEHALTRKDVEELIAATEIFVNGIESAWQKVKPGAGLAAAPPAIPKAAMKPV
jgi:hypothetical protein